MFRRNSLLRLPIRILWSDVSCGVGTSRSAIRRWWLLTVAGILASFPAAAMAQTNNEATFSLSGSVVNAVTGEPVGRALVQLRSTPPRSAFTDGNGHFEIDGLPAGRFAIGAQKPGYYNGPDDARSGFNFSVAVGPTSDAVTLSLSPFGVIYGRVTNIEGEALEHIPVRLTAAVVRNGRKRWEQMGSRESDENGVFRFPNLQPGTFYLAAGPSSDENEAPHFAVSGKDSAGGAPRTGYPSAYYPNAPDLSSASPIVLAPGQQLQTEFVLPRVPLYRISGTIAGFSPDAGVNLQLTTASGEILSLSPYFEQALGTFRLDGVPPGSYVLKGFGRSARGEDLRASVPVTVATNVNNVRLTLEPVTTIPIVVRKESHADASASQEGAVTSLSRRFSTGVPVSVRLSPVGPSLNVADTYSTLRENSGEHTPILENVEPGRYTVEFMPQGGWYVQSAEYAGSNLLTDEMTVRSGASGPMQIVLRDDGASLEGTVKSGNASGHTGVVVILPQQGAEKRPLFAGVYGDGGFRKEGLPPGDYLVFAAENGRHIEYDDPEVLQPYLSQATHVTLSAGQSGKVTLNVVRSGDASQ